uniref:Uncharacterized protein n=1 Tax=Timema monikensis TaxID=170555 RepID=A0A7R9HPX3_9NEOP|nr:unnamed protein product [Timema monikensis]
MGPGSGAVLVVLFVSITTLIAVLNHLAHKPVIPNSDTHAGDPPAQPPADTHKSLSHTLAVTVQHSIK